MTDPVGRARRCLRALLQSQPFFGTLALHLPLIADGTRQTLASDGESIRFNPGWLDKTPSHEVQAAIARVVLACALKHHTRRGDRDYARWQEASRLVTLPILADAGLVDAAADGLDMTIEQAFAALPEMPPQNGGGAAPAGGATAQQDGQPADDGQPASVDPHGAGEVMDAPVADEDAQLQAQEQRWDTAMHQAAAIGRASGQLPSSMEELIGGAHVRPVPWREYLSEYMHARVADDYTWSRPNRRHIGSGIYLPAMESDGMAALAFMVDTSASMDADALAAVWQHVRSLCEEMRPPAVFVMQGDTDVRGIDAYTAHDLPETLTAHGRGGTRFGPMLAALETLPLPPDVAIYFTDGGTSEDVPPPPPCCDVLWALTRPNWKPWFGTAVEVSA